MTRLATSDTPSDMPKTEKKATSKASKTYAVIVDGADIRQQRGGGIGGRPRGKSAVGGKAKAERETKWPPLWQALIAHDKAGRGSYITLAQLWDVSHMKVYRWGVEGREPSRLEKWGIQDFCRRHGVDSPV